MPLEQLQKKLPSEKWRLYEAPQCGQREAQQVGDPAAWPYVPGRQHALEGRGHCLISEGLCECFPPWRGASCDQLEGGRRGTVIVTMASNKRLHELHFVLEPLADRSRVCRQVVHVIGPTS